MWFNERQNILPGKNIEKQPYCHIFHHIPKCGGTSVLEVLDKWFKCVCLDHRPGFDLGEEFADFLVNRKQLTSLDSNTILCGHFELNGSYLHQRYPAVIGNPKYRVITFVREPLEIQKSLYYYEKSVGELDRQMDARLKDGILTRPNYLAKRFPCNEANFKSVLDRYYFIGITEKLQESCDYLAGILKKQKVKVPRKNMTVRDYQEQELSDDDIEAFKEANKLDYFIYDYCVRSFMDRINQGTCNH